MSYHHKTGLFEGDLGSINLSETLISEFNEDEWDQEFRRRRASYRWPSQRRPVRPSYPSRLPHPPWRPKRPRPRYPTRPPSIIVDVVSPRPPYPWPPPEPPWPPQEPPPSGPTVAASEPAEPALAKPGGEYVRWVQHTLNRVMGLRLPVDGIMGPGTRSAIRDFQRREGLLVDGIAGPETKQALITARKRLSSAAEEFEAFDTEFTDKIWEGEVSRRSRDYIRWVQQALNRVLGLRLTVDGIIGSQTRSAVRTFQERYGLTVDGIVGPQTERALIAAGAGQPPQTTTSVPARGTNVSITAPLPQSGPGFYSYVGSGRRYGQVQTIQTLQAIGRAWQQAHPSGPRIGTGDISFQGGGEMPPHKSHQTGLDVDIRPMRSDGREGSVRYQDATYSRVLTQELVNRIINNGILRVQYIFFNDPDVRSVRHWPGHDNHLHVRFYPPSVSASNLELDRVWESVGAEPTDQTWEGEVNRSSRDYVQWVQRSLNKIMGLRLDVDGIIGPMTRSAIRSFQQKYGLAVDGIVGPQTERALIAAGAGNPPGVVSSPYVPPAAPLQPSPGTPTSTQLARQIINSGRVSFLTYHTSGCGKGDRADATSNINDTANGRAAGRSGYDCSSSLPAAPGGSISLNDRMLNGMLSLSQSYTFRVTEIAGGQHSGNSRHYAGVAFDVDLINGVPVNSSNPYYQAFLQRCRALGATEVLGPGDAGHSTHIHCGWPRP